jgi:hypothetical protein
MRNLSFYAVKKEGFSKLSTGEIPVFIIPVPVPPLIGAR